MLHYTYRKGIALAILGLSSTFVFGAPPRPQPYGAKATSLISSYGGGYDENNNGGGYFLSATSAKVSSNQFVSGAGSARASLASGTLGAFAASERNQNFAWIVNQSGGSFWDTVTITASGENLGIIPLQFELDGSADGSGKAAFSGWVYDLDNDEYIINHSQSNLTGNAKFDTAIDTELAPLVERHFMVGMGISAHANIDYGIWGGNTATADYMRTLHFRWDMPEGVTFKSASGVFNPEAITQPVPEPATMAALGLGVLGIARKRRKRSL